MIAPDAPRYFPPKSASTMEVSMVTSSLSSPSISSSSSPLNVNVDMALVSKSEVVSASDDSSRQQWHVWWY
jgi:hypothetical protein